MSVDDENLITNTVFAIRVIASPHKIYWVSDIKYTETRELIQYTAFPENALLFLKIEGRCNDCLQAIMGINMLSAKIVVRPARKALM